MKSTTHPLHANRVAELLGLSEADVCCVERIESLKTLRSLRANVTLGSRPHPGRRSEAECFVWLATAAYLNSRYQSTKTRLEKILILEDGRIGVVLSLPGDWRTNAGVRFLGITLQDLLDAYGWMRSLEGQA